MGFMLGGKYFSLYGPDTTRAFGHLGFTNIISWADPERQVAATLMTSGKPLVYPELYFLHDVVWNIGTACTKTAPRHTAIRRRSVARRSARRASHGH